MVLYCLFAVPIFSLFVLSYKLSRGADAKQLWVQFSRGLLTFIPAYIIFLLVAGRIPLVYTYGGIYGYYFFHDAFLLSVMGALSYILIRAFSRAPEKDSVSHVFVFFAGYFTFASVLEIVRHFPNYNYYLLFLLPTLRLAVIAAFAFLVARYFSAEGWTRWAYLAIALLFLAATALVPFFFLIHVGYAAIIVTVVLFAAALFPYAVMSLQGGRASMPDQPSPVR